MKAFDVVVLARLSTHPHTPRALLRRLYIAPARVPWGTRLDIEGLNALIREPILDGIGNQLRTIVASDVLRRSVALDSRDFPQVVDSLLGKSFCQHQ